ncbi:MAG: 5-(carboxyamino)imidazole ribonucleotide synthase [Ignavibacteria bacterium]|nr:5-(carboxyamino)imidazole ribonucleotide synthase [Ignavibacteria bacterium]
MNKPIRIGILGGGQLARMSAFAAYRMGFDIAILEKIINSPAGQLTKSEFIGWVDNKKILKKFCEVSDIVTLENEFIDHKYLEYIESLGKKVIPSSKTISLIQDKLIQKQVLSSAKIPVAKFIAVDNKSDYDSISNELGNKFILKSRKMGYDGYGNSTIRNKKGYSEAIGKLKNRHSELYAEEFIHFKKELAVMVVRTDKQIKTYPVVETIQKKHICHTVIAPADISEEIRKKTIEISIQAVKSVKGYGLFGIELFLTKDENVLINEMAPRPHNSGHFTIEACVTSQFENHIRSVLNLELGSTEMVKPAAVMINLLGKKNGAGVISNIKETFGYDNVHLHIYGKHESRIGRKMGHITMIGENSELLLNILSKVEKKIII